MTDVIVQTSAVHQVRVGRAVVPRGLIGATVAPLALPPDDVVDALEAATIAKLENYLRRGVVYQSQEDEFLPIDVRDGRLQLSRFPVDKSQSITVTRTAPDGTETIVPATDYTLRAKHGILELNAYQRECCCNTRTFSRQGDSVTVEYVGGYDPLPAELADAVAGAVALRIKWLDDASSTTSVSFGSGEIKSIAADGVQISYDTSSLVSAQEGVPPELVPFAAVLDYYRAPLLGGI